MLGADRVETHDARAVDHEHGRPLTEAERATHHVVGVEDGVIGVRDDRKRNRVLLQEPLDRGRRLGCDGDDRRAGGGELSVVVAQLRKVPAAERSGEAAEKHQDDGAMCK